MSKLIAAAGDATPGCTINFNEPGALEALQHSNPTRYEAVVTLTNVRAEIVPLK